MIKFLSSCVRTAVLSACCFLILPTLAHADVQTIRNANNEVWGSFGTSFLNYKEPSTAPYLPDSEHGWMPSFAAGASIMGYPENGILSNSYFAIEGSGTFGQTNYNGAYLASPSTPLQGTTNDTIWTFDGKLGRGFPVGPAVVLTPYVELGLRTWRRELGPGQAEDYQHTDGLGGLMVQFAPTSRLVLTGYGSLGSTFSPEMKTNGYSYHLSDSGIYKIGGKVGFDVTQQVELFTTLDYDTFRYGQSGVVADGTYEPNSKTEDTAWRVGLAYHFR